ncbi:MAG: PilZ domain-containing protein [Chromatocurvus sp.]
MTDQDDTSQAADGLTYSDNIALSWRPVEHELDKTHLAMVNASNESFLRAVSVIGDGASQKDPQENAAGFHQEIARLDLKLNLLLDLVSSLVYHELDIPGTRAVSVSASGVQWEGSVPEPGSRVFLELYIQRGLPKPLCCYGEVITSDADYAAGKASVRFVGLSGAAHDWLGKLIFRHHRREVAYRRASAE